MREFNQEKDPPTYGYGQIYSPFVSAQSGWDRPIGRWCYRAFLWRVACFGALGMTALVLLMLILTLAYPKIQILSFQTTTRGFISQIGILNKSYTIPAGYKTAFLSLYLVNAYQYLGNYPQDQANERFVKQFSSGPVLKQYEQRLKATELSKALVKLELDRVQEVSPNVLTADWREIVQDRENGALLRVDHFHGTFNVNRLNLKNSTFLSENPLGFYVYRALLVNMSSGMKGGGRG